MDTLTFPKKVLMEKVLANRELHEETYEKAMIGFRSEAQLALFEKLESLEQFDDDENDEVWDGDIKRGRTGLYISIQGPEYHGDDYDRVLEMLRLTDQESISLNEEQFAKYVMDEWEWKESFHISTTAYLNR